MSIPKFTDAELSILKSYLKEIYSTSGDIHIIPIEQLRKEEDGSYLYDDSEREYAQESFGDPGVEWITDMWCTYACDGKHVEELTTAFNKCIDAGWMKWNEDHDALIVDSTKIWMEDVVDQHGECNFILHIVGYDA
jgi:hypothetical protein